jgi:ABC-type sulfate/molybdate transport systems ATPase subunit
VLDADVEVDRREFAVCAHLRVAPGERLALFGPSGAGKTTLLEVIAGLVRPRRGRVQLDARVLTSIEPPKIFVPPWQRRVGLLRQDPGLFPHLSVRGNLCYGLGADPAGRELAQVADALGISALLSAMPAGLSGGQAHRVALGRLLLAHCDALLLDEPYTGLDAGLRRSLTELVAELVDARAVPAVLVAHELAEAQAFAHRLAILDHGELLQVGAPDEVVLRPASRRVAELVGYLGFVPSAGPHAAVAGVHPERVTSGAHAERGLVLTGMVTGCRPSGAGWEADLAIGATTITCRLPERAAEVGDELVVTVVDPPWFGPDGAAATEPGGPSASSAPGGPSNPEQVGR